MSSNNHHHLFYTEIKVAPAVWRIIDNNYIKRGEVYDFRKHQLYNFISISLFRKQTTTTSALPLQYNKLKKIKVALTSWDYNHFGFVIAPFQQVIISNLLYKQILYDACYRIMICHVFGGMPRDAAIKNYLSENGFEEQELSYSTLRKHYQRHFIDNELFLKKNQQEFNPFLTQNSHVFNTKKNVKIVPICKN